MTLAYQDIERGIALKLCHAAMAMQALKRLRVHFKDNLENRYEQLGAKSWAIV